MIQRFSALIILLVVLGVSCQARTIPTVPIVPTVGAERLVTPTPTSRCDRVGNLSPERPTIPRPEVIQIPVITPQSTLASARSDLIDARFYSDLLDEVMPLLIYLPPGYYDSQHRYPAVYMLSGFAGDYREWATYGACSILDTLIRGGKVQPMIMVMPEGEQSWWFNHAPVPGSDGKPYGDYVWKDVVSHIDANYRTLPRRESRAIGGLSSGGQGALMLGLTHPEVFSVIGAHSPSFRGADGSLVIFGDPDYFKQYDPIWIIQNSDTWKQLTIWIDKGKEDQQWGSAIEYFHALLDQYGVSHEFQDAWYGTHDGNYWAAHLSDYLVWYASKLKGE
jgi:enterochelin esterase-like enzyme